MSCPEVGGLFCSAGERGDELTEGGERCSLCVMNFPATAAVVFTSLAMLCPWAGAQEKAPEESAGKSKESQQRAPKDLRELVKNLGNEAFSVRIEATRELWRAGEEALPYLRDALKSEEPEVFLRAQELIRKIELRITPDTPASVIALVEKYEEATTTEEKSAIFSQLKTEKAWFQILKIYEREKDEDLKKKLMSKLAGVATRAAREKLVLGEDRAAEELLEMAPADASSLLALAEYHRSHGTLEREIAKAKTLKDGEDWLLALYRAAGNAQAAQQVAKAAGENEIAATMAMLTGDPVPWLEMEHTGEKDAISVYIDLAKKRWRGEKLSPSDLAYFNKKLASSDHDEETDAVKMLCLLGETQAGFSALEKINPRLMFAHYDAQEGQVDKALKILGLDPDAKDHTPWVAKHVEALTDAEIEDQHEASTDKESLVDFAKFLENRGLRDESYTMFSGPVLALAEKKEAAFHSLLSSLFGSLNETKAPLLAQRIGAQWAGNDPKRWKLLLADAFGGGDVASDWWSWVEEMDPGASHAERFRGMIALFCYAPDQSNLRTKILAKAEAAVESLPAGQREKKANLVFQLCVATGDSRLVHQMWDRLSDEDRKENEYIHTSALVALGRWEEAAELALKQATETPENAKLHAYAAALLRKAGREKEATQQDAWVDKLALGQMDSTYSIAFYYCLGADFQRAEEWCSRALYEADTDSSTFSLALSKHADFLLAAGQWQKAAAAYEVKAMDEVTGESERTGNTVLFDVQLRAQADTARALSRLKDHRAESLETLQTIHRQNLVDGSLADYFFPALQKAGLRAENNAWFKETWKQMENTIKRYPNADNEKNTAAWLASRACCNLDEAEQCLTQALELHPLQAAYMDTMAEIYFAKGKREKALEWSGKSLNYFVLSMGDDFLQILQQRERFCSAPFPK